MDGGHCNALNTVRVRRGWVTKVDWGRLRELRVWIRKIRSDDGQTDRQTDRQAEFPFVDSTPVEKKSISGGDIFWIYFLTFNFDSSKWYLFGIISTLNSSNPMIQTSCSDLAEFEGVCGRDHMDISQEDFINKVHRWHWSSWPPWYYRCPTQGWTSWRRSWILMYQSRSRRSSGALFLSRSFYNFLFISNLSPKLNFF